MEVRTSAVNGSPSTCLPVSNFMHQEAQRLDTKLRDQESKLTSQVRRHQALEEEEQQRISFLSENPSYLGYPPLIAENKEELQIWKKYRAFLSQAESLRELLRTSIAQCEQTRQEITETLDDLARFRKTPHSSDSPT